MKAFIVVFATIGLLTSNGRAELSENVTLGTGEAGEGDPWPAETPVGAADHSGHDGATYWQNFVGEFDSDITPQLGKVVWAKNEWNKTANAVTWDISETVKTTHKWNVGVEVVAALKPGMLAKIVVDAKVEVTVNGGWTGEFEKSRQTTVSTQIDACRGKRRVEKVDAYHAEITQWSADEYWYCSQHGYGVASNLVQGTGDGDGDDNLQGEFSDLGPYSQSDDPCLHCYQAP